MVLHPMQSPCSGRVLLCLIRDERSYVEDSIRCEERGPEVVKIYFALLVVQRVNKGSSGITR